MSCNCKTTEKYQVKLVDIIRHNEDTFSFDFESKDELTWSEGDHSKLYINIKNSELGKKFSYATHPDESIIRFTTRVKSKRSDYKETLCKLKIGESIELSAPSGEFGLKRVNRPLVLLSNGVGIAASRSQIKSYELDPTDIPYMLQINVDASGSIYKSELDQLKAELDNFDSVYISGRETYYSKLDHEVQKIINHHELDPIFYIVGSGGFVNDTINHLKSVGFSSDDMMTDGHVSEASCDCESDNSCGCGSNLVMIKLKEELLQVS